MNSYIERESPENHRKEFSPYPCVTVYKSYKRIHLYIVIRRLVFGSNPMAGSWWSCLVIKGKTVLI